MVRVVVGLLTAAHGVTTLLAVTPPTLPCSWRDTGDAVSSDERLNFVFALQSQNLAELHQLAKEVSDPRSARYGKHLTQAELEELTAPLPQHVAVVTDWLHRNGAETRLRGLGSVIEASVLVSNASRMFQTRFHQHVNDATGQLAVRASDYVLPMEVDNALSAVFGLHGLPLPPRDGRQSGDDILAVTPELIATTYGINGVTPSSSEGNRQAVAEFQQKQLMNSTDLKIFFDSYVPGSSEPQKVVHKFVGDTGDGRAGTEAALDIEYLMGVAPGVLTDFYYHQSNDFCTDLVQWTSEILDDSHPPLVHSVSYGYQGDLSRLGCTDDQVATVDANFAKLAARGITLVISSGDSGSGYEIDCDKSQQHNATEVTEGTVLENVGFLLLPTPEGCCALANSGVAWEFKRNGVWPTCKVFSEVNAMGPSDDAVTGGPGVIDGYVPKLWPSWPASSPWVTAVGGTRFDKQQAGEEEIAVDQFGSGGGFSWMFDAFDEQKEFTAAYLANAPGLHPAGSFPPGGRGTPDVSALGEGYQTLINGKLESVGGTSASAPAFAAMISLINEARLSSGKPVMGYLNPFLYQNADAFTDVTMGSNAISRIDGEALLYGFNCTKGWDPVTGLGTPKFEKLLQAAMSAAGETVVV